MHVSLGDATDTPIYITTDPSNVTAGTSILPPCSTITLPVGFVGPVNCDNSMGGPNYSVSAGQSQAQAQQAAAVACSQAGGTFDPTSGACSQSNMSTYLMIALAAVVIGGAILGGRG